MSGGDVVLGEDLDRTDLAVVHLTDAVADQTECEFGSDVGRPERGTNHDGVVGDAEDLAADERAVEIVRRRPRRCDDVVPIERGPPERTVIDEPVVVGEERDQPIDVTLVLGDPVLAQDSRGIGETVTLEFEPSVLESDGRWRQPVCGESADGHHLPVRVDLLDVKPPGRADHVHQREPLTPDREHLAPLHRFQLERLAGFVPQGGVGCDRLDDELAVAAPHPPVDEPGPVARLVVQHGPALGYQLVEPGDRTVDVVLVELLHPGDQPGVGVADDQEHASRIELRSVGRRDRESLRSAQRGGAVESEDPLVEHRRPVADGADGGESLPPLVVAQ